MGLSIFVHESRPVVLVEWFLECRGLVEYAHGPAVRIPQEDFRTTGFGWIKGHFQRHGKFRLAKNAIQKVFLGKEARNAMKGTRCIEIHLNPDGEIVLSPMVIEKYGIGELRRVEPLRELNLDPGCTAEDFWFGFDKVLAAAHLDR